MIVMKFGGTSVEDAKAINRAADIVKGRRADRPVVVVSAMARITDQLLSMARAAGDGDRKTALKLARALRERHYETAGELLGTALFTQFHGELGADFDSLDELIRGISAVGELTPRTTDQVARIARHTAELIEVGRDLADEEIQVLEGWAGEVYGIPVESTMEAMRLGAELEAMITDPVYEGKSLAGLIDLVRTREIPRESTVLYAHLGGQPALNAYHSLWP